MSYQFNCISVLFINFYFIEKTFDSILIFDVSRGKNGPAILTSHDVGDAYVVLETRNSSWWHANRWSPSKYVGILCYVGDTHFGANFDDDFCYKQSLRYDLSKISKICYQYILSPTSVTNIEVIFYFKTSFWKRPKINSEQTQSLLELISLEYFGFIHDLSFWYVWRANQSRFGGHCKPF